MLQDVRQNMQRTPTANAGRISLDDALRKEIRSQQQQIRNLTDYIPLEGTVNEDAYIIGPGDQFLVGFAGTEEEKYIVPVGADGFLILPYSSSIKVSEKSLRQAKADIIEGLSKYFRAQDISVTLVSARLFVVHVTGMVSLPGAYVVSAVDRVNSAVEAAGGALLSAQLSRVKLIRDGDTLAVDLNRYKTSGVLASNPTLRDGDVIFVPGFDPASAWVFLSGASFTDGTINIDRGESVSKLISRVGADRDRIDFGTVNLIRGGESRLLNLLSDDREVALASGDSVFLSLLPDSVYVGGRVVSGGSVKYVGGLSARAYVAMAGGISKEGSMGKVCIYRHGEKLSERKAGGIKPGDAIIVGTDGFYYVSETVKSIGQLGTFISAIYVITRN